MSLDQLHDALTSVLWPGQKIVLGQGAATPHALLSALPEHLDRLQGSTLFLGLLLREIPELPGVNIEAFYPSGPLGTVEGLEKHNAKYMRQTLYAAATRFASSESTIDLAFAKAAPEAGGAYSLGTSLDFIMPAVSKADRVLLECSSNMPRTGAASLIPSASNVTAFILGDGPIAYSTAITDSSTPEDLAIANALLPWLPDGSTLEFGIGRWFPPLLARIAETRRGMKIHTGQVGEWVERLMLSGALDRTCKIVGTGAAGSSRFYEFLDDHVEIELFPATYTHAPEVLNNLESFRAVNSVFEVDLLGQANSELVGTRMSGIAGLPDFARGAVNSPDGLSIVVLSSTAKGRSRIVPEISVSPPSLASGEIDILVTEHGSVDLRGLAPTDLAEAIICVADPQHRQTLRQACK